MRIVVSGATGLIGSAVVQTLAKHHDIVSIGRHAGDHLHCDFSDPTSVKRLNFVGIQAVVHCAGVVDEDFQDNPIGAFVRASVSMAELVARAKSCGVAQFAYISSAHVYGPLEGSIDENRAPNPLSDYALAHFMSEQILHRAANPTFRGVVFRPCAVFGIPPNLNSFRRWALIPFEFPKSIVMNNSIVLKSSGNQNRNFVGVTDIARSVEHWICEHEKPVFQIINPVGKATMSVWQFAQLCGSVAEELCLGPISFKRMDGAPISHLLEYETLYQAHRGEQDLRDTIFDLMESLSASRARVY